MNGVVTGLFISMDFLIMPWAKTSTDSGFVDPSFIDESFGVISVLFLFKQNTCYPPFLSKGKVFISVSSIFLGVGTNIISFVELVIIYLIVFSSNPIYCVSKERTSTMPLTGFGHRQSLWFCGIQIQMRSEAVPPPVPGFVDRGSLFYPFFRFSEK